MKDQQEPITDDEWLLRRVHKEYFESLVPPLIRPYAFKPQLTGRLPDTTGISLYRQSCLNRTEDIFVKTMDTKRHSFGIVRVPVSLLYSNGLNVIRDDDLDDPIVLGHVVVPEINSREYEQTKDSVVPLMKALSDYVNEHKEFLMLPRTLE
jgi:hypothetical protein